MIPGGLVRLWSRVVPTPGYYGWTVALVALGCSALTGPGQSFFLSLYLEHFVADLGLSRVELASLYSVATLAAAAVLPFAGRLADRVPSGRFLGGVFLLLSLAFVHMATVRNALALGVTLFPLRFLAQGAIGLGTITTAVRWFRRYRGRALAFVTLGYAVGEMTFPSLVLALVAAVGWRGSWLVLAAAYWLFLAPAVYWLLRERDASREPIDGLARADAAAATGAAGGTSEAEHAEVDEHAIALGAAVRMPVFWGLLLCVAVPPLVATGVIFHQVRLFASRGWTATLVAPAFMCYAAASIVATTVTGLVLERRPARFGVATALTLLVVALAAPWLPLPALPAALLYGTLLGLASGTIASANAVVWPDYFGVAALGTIKGVVNAVRNGATALGPPIVALLITGDGSYAPAVTVLAGLAVVAAPAALMMRPPRLAPQVEQPALPHAA